MTTESEEDMTIILYVYTGSPMDDEEFQSIKKTVDQLVIPRFKADETASYIYGDKIENMSIILHKGGSTKNSVVARMRKECEWLRKRWARMYNYEVSVRDDLNDILAED